MDTTYTQDELNAVINSLVESNNNLLVQIANLSIKLEKAKKQLKNTEDGN